MEFINSSVQEESICNNGSISKRDNSPQIDYMNKINDKPWGKEYLAFQNKYIGIWILHVNKDQETSLHCHFKKDTILIPLHGCFKINLYNDKFKILHLFDSLFVPRTGFHGIHSYVDDGILMEIEIYTENIEYTDKNDLLRIKDIYNRDKNSYESSVTERDPQDGETMSFMSPNKYNIYSTEIQILELSKSDNPFLSHYNKFVLLEGCVYSNETRCTPGSFIELNKPYSLLSNSIKVLCIHNIHYGYINKVIYSKNHLRDYKQSFNLNFSLKKVGLTSGCFDILHEGHIKTLKLCKKNCDSLFVCLSSDEQIKRLKGNARPINNLCDRIIMLIYFDFIDNVILYDEINDSLESELDNIMQMVDPYVWFKGSDYNKEEVLKKHPGLKNIMLFDLVEGKSTTTIVNKKRRIN